MPGRRRGCSTGAVWGLLVVLALVALAACWLASQHQQQAGSVGGGSLSLRPTLMLTTATRRTPTPSATAAIAPTRMPFADALPSAAPDWGALQRLMLDAINQDRAAAHLQPVAWDQLAADVGAAHASEMVAQGYFSHWNVAGQGPDLRYALAGGFETVNENLHLYWLRYADGRGAPIDDWEAVVLAGQQGLMESPGHRSNILDPAHTHVGIGMAYDPATGTLAIAQEFINRYVVLSDPPRVARRGASYSIRGKAVSGISDPVVNVRYLPHPAPLSIEQVEQKPAVYQSESTFFDYGAASLNSGVELTFELPADAPAGIYLVCLWVETPRQHGEETQVLTLALPLVD